MIDIIENNSTWIIVNKPAGLSVHNAEDKTNLLQELEVQGLMGFSAVNRLDKETTGLMVLSSDKKVYKALQAAFSSDNCTKTYKAVVKGQFKEDQLSGSWDDDLTDKAEGRDNPQGITKSRVKCLTHYKVLKTSKYLSHLELKLESGRQHQIRKHSVLNKHQIIGDARYGDRKLNSLIKKKYSFRDMALHSYKLNFYFGCKEYSFVCEPPESWKTLQGS
jgi:23S rRNA-/tRNA-specific pseudouridylate synthase